MIKKIISNRLSIVLVGVVAVSLAILLVSTRFSTTPEFLGFACDNVSESIIEEAAMLADTSMESNYTPIEKYNDMLSTLKRDCAEYMKSKDYHYLAIKAALKVSDVEAAEKSFELYKNAPESTLRISSYITIEDDELLQSRIKSTQDILESQIKSINAAPLIIVPEGEGE